MSKSLGNGIDPLEIIEEYGADALRLTLMTGNAPGNDMRFSTDQVVASRNFANKIWNASRFIMMNLPEGEIRTPERDELLPADRWILSRINTVAKEVTENLDRYELGIAASKIHDFLWDEFCDWYIEIAKLRFTKNKDDASANAALWTLRTVLTEGLKLLHPYMPFVTEEIYCTLLPEEETIMTSAWPEYRDDWNFPEEEAQIATLQSLVRGIRNLRMEMNVPNATKTDLFIAARDDEAAAHFSAMIAALPGIERMLYAKEITVRAGKEGVAEDSATVVLSDATAYIPLDELVDKVKEIARLTAESAKMDKEIARASGMLANPNFVNKAPAAKVQAERDKLEKFKAIKQQVEEQLARYK